MRTGVSSAQETSWIPNTRPRSPDWRACPPLQGYLDSLGGEERQQAQGSACGDGRRRPAQPRVSEPQHTEFDYPVDDVVGKIPPGLTGTLYRNGPGRWQDHTGRPLHHLFDGDGMISAFTIRNGTVHYRNRYVRTQHFRGRSGTRHLEPMPPAGGWPISAVCRPTSRTPTSSSTPGASLPSGRAVRRTNFTPIPWKPSVCADSEAYYAGLERIQHIRASVRAAATCSTSSRVHPHSPHLRVYRTGNGRLGHYRSASLPMSRWCTTSRSRSVTWVFLISPIIPDGIPIALGLKSFGDGIQYRPERGSSFILIPRDGGRIRRIDCDPVLQFHLSNAFDDHGDVVADVITLRDRSTVGASRDSAPVRYARRPRNSPGSGSLATVASPASNSSDRTCNSPAPPRSRGAPAPLRLRQHPATPRHALRRDHQDRPRGWHRDQLSDPGHGQQLVRAGVHPRPGACDEDDGWLLSVEYQTDLHRSRLVILDASDLDRGPLATAQLNHHVPQGFHGNFVA